MPSTQKIVFFMGCACCTAVSVALLGYAMSTKWAQTRVECRGLVSDTFNGTGVITWDLFSGTFDSNFCPFIGNSVEFKVFEKIKDSGAPAVLYVLVVFLLCLCLVFSALSILIALYNSVSNPYETYMGPIGVYICSSISASVSALVLILFAVAVSATNMAESVILGQAEGTAVEMRNRQATFYAGYFLVIPYTILSLASIAVIYMYDHAAYTHRREQQRPTEDAPKEIMMY
ncbi:clarin-3 [Boleophthalmus pectinirostris]|uniref:clarin-3 n=1 Tax=Boleophthalmus pectinirostris TaxID=150288 RepID=UPI00242E94AE|nr:clarin-3 [Boleophthalmus pectinirostris]